MYHKLYSFSRFWLVLYLRDHKEFLRLHKSICQSCNSGKLYAANYRRKPRGQPKFWVDAFDIRFSLCCSQEGCRHRVTLRSVRFLGRKVYLNVAVILASAFYQGGFKVSMIQNYFGMSARTLWRWLLWWQELVSSEFWRIKRGEFVPGLRETDITLSLIRWFKRVHRLSGKSMLYLVRFLAPMSTPSPCFELFE
jgi:hypothetical protein